MSASPTPEPAVHVERRSAALPVLVGPVELILLAPEVNALLDGIDSLAEGLAAEVAQKPGTGEEALALADGYARLRETLLTACRTFADPPLELDRGEADRLRGVLADLRGYQRSDLPEGLSRLAGALDAAR